MSDIPIGPVVIQDLNQNNLFDPGVDAVVDPSGQPFSPAREAAELHQITQELGTSGWSGILLSDAATMVNGLRDAAAYAQLGNVPMVELRLKEAELGAQKLGLPFPQTRADGILKDAYQNGIPILELDARSKAAAGDFFGAVSGFRELKRLIPAANLKFGLHFNYNPILVGKAVENAFIIGNAQLYQNIHQAALHGQAILVRHRLRHLKNQISNANSQFQLNLSFDAKRADAILEAALVNGIADNFKLAKSAARGHSSRSARRWLDLARSYVDEYNRKFAAPRKGKPQLAFDFALAGAIMACAHGQGACP